jgi:hypothetical protein
MKGITTNTPRSTGAENLIRRLQGALFLWSMRGGHHGLLLLMRRDMRGDMWILTLLEMHTEITHLGLNTGQSGKLMIQNTWIHITTITEYLPSPLTSFFVRLTWEQRASRYAERPVDYPPRPPYDYDDRDTKRFRGPPHEPSDPVYDRPPPPADDRPPPPREYPAPSYTHRPPPPYYPAVRERTRPQGRYFLVKTSTAENIEKSRESVTSQIYFLC